MKYDAGTACRGMNPDGTRDLLAGPQAFRAGDGPIRLPGVKPCWNGTGNLVEQALVDQRRQHLPLGLRHVGAREVLADGRLGDAAAFDDAAFFVAIQCFVG